MFCRQRVGIRGFEQCSVIMKASCAVKRNENGLFKIPVPAELTEVCHAPLFSP